MNWLRGGYWHIAARDVCDGKSAVSESRHRIPGASIGQPTVGLLGGTFGFLARPIQHAGRITSGLVLGGLHHHYCRT